MSPVRLREYLLVVAGFLLLVYSFVGSKYHAAAFLLGGSLLGLQPLIDGLVAVARGAKRDET